MVNAYESCIEKPEREKLGLHERIAKSLPRQGRLEDCTELFLKFLSSSWNIRKNGDFAMRQTVLGLAFSEPLKCSLKGVYGIPNLSLPFKHLKEILELKSEMVRSQGKGLNRQFNPLADEEWIVLFDTLEKWERYLAQLDSKSLRCNDEHFRP